MNIDGPAMESIRLKTSDKIKGPQDITRGLLIFFAYTSR
jgi:hypothetical protein